MNEVDRRSTKLENSIRELRKVYERASIIPEATNHRPFVEGADDPSGFTQIGVRHLVPKEWFDSESNFYPDITDMGRSVAIGEERLLFQSVTTSVSGAPRRTSKVLPEDVNSSIEALASRGFSATVMFAPIELYTTIHSWRNENKTPFVRYPAGPIAYFVSGGRTLRIFWSNKYVPLDRIIIYDKSYGLWLVKPDTGTKHYLRIEPKESERDHTKLDITVRTVAKFLPEHVDRANIILPENPLPPIQ